MKTAPKTSFVVQDIIFNNTNDTNTTFKSNRSDARMKQRLPFTAMLIVLVLLVSTAAGAADTAGISLVNYGGTKVGVFYGDGGQQDDNEADDKESNEDQDADEGDNGDSNDESDDAADDSDSEEDDEEKDADEDSNERDARNVSKDAKEEEKKTKDRDSYDNSSEAEGDKTRQDVNETEESKKRLNVTSNETGGIAPLVLEQVAERIQDQVKYKTIIVLDDVREKIELKKRVKESKIVHLEITIDEIQSMDVLEEKDDFSVDETSNASEKVQDMDVDEIKEVVEDEQAKKDLDALDESEDAQVDKSLRTYKLKDSKDEKEVSKFVISSIADKDYDEYIIIEAIPKYIVDSPYGIKFSKIPEIIDPENIVFKWVFNDVKKGEKVEVSYIVPKKVDELDTLTVVGEES